MAIRMVTHEEYLKAPDGGEVWDCYYNRCEYCGIHLHYEDTREGLLFDVHKNRVLTCGSKDCKMEHEEQLREPGN